VPASYAAALQERARRATEAQAVIADPGLPAEKTDAFRGAVSQLFCTWLVQTGHIRQLAETRD
jgi:hypothetical protein